MVNQHKKVVKDNHNYGADLLRVIIMTWIVLYHYTFIYNTLGFEKEIHYPFSFTDGGTVGVSLFFVLSGFFFNRTFTTANSGLKTYGAFLVKRYLRLWFPYFVACIIVFLWLCILPLPNRSVDLSIFLLNLPLFIHPGINYVDGAHWFLADLFFVQGLLGLLLLIREGKSRENILTTIFVISSVLQFFQLPFLDTTIKRIFEIGFGLQMFYLCRKDNLIYHFLMCVLGLIVTFNYSLEYMCWALFMIFVLDFSSIRNRFLFLTRDHKDYGYAIIEKQCKRILLFLGNISFMWYLIHQNIGYTIQYYYFPTYCDGAFIFIPILGTLALAICANHIVVRIKSFLHFKFL